MQKRRLGRTGLDVSIIGFGGIPIAGLDWKPGCEVVRHAFELGINYFDTARAYGNSEEKIGAALEDVRDRCILATKTLARTKQEAARTGIKQSLRCLRTDRIDIVHLHGIDDEKTLKDAMGTSGSLAALKEARQEGKIDFIAISGHRPYILANAIKTGEFDTLLVPFNIVTRDALDILFSVAKDMDVGVVIMKPFAGGSILSDPELDTILREDPAQKVERALRFILAQSAVSTVVPGLGSVEQVKAAVKAGEEFKGLTEEEKRLMKIDAKPSEPYCRECGLCVPCPDGLNISHILGLEKFFFVYGLGDRARRSYQRLNTKVNGCSECGRCEPRCPYCLPIIKMLHEADGRLGTPVM